MSDLKGQAMGNLHERKFKDRRDGFADLAKTLKDQSLWSHIMASAGYLLIIFGFDWLFSWLFPEFLGWISIALESKTVAFLLFAVFVLIIALTWFYKKAKLVKDYKNEAAVCLQDYEALLNSQDALAKENDRLIAKEFILDKLLLSNGINLKEDNFNGQQELEDNQDN